MTVRGQNMRPHLGPRIMTRCRLLGSNLPEARFWIKQLYAEGRPLTWRDSVVTHKRSGCGIIGAGIFAIRDRKNHPKVVTLTTEQLLSRLRERLSEPAMLDLTKRLIAIPSENPPGNHY